MSRILLGALDATLTLIVAFLVLVGLCIGVVAISTGVHAWYPDSLGSQHCAHVVQHSVDPTLDGLEAVSCS